MKKKKTELNERELYEKQIPWIWMLGLEKNLCVEQKNSIQKCMKIPWNIFWFVREWNYFEKIL